MRQFATGYLIVVAIMSCVAFVAYGVDKHFARTGKRRVPEKNLHMVAFFGGWPGALVGRRRFRHKTQKMQFRLAFWLVVACHLALTTLLAYLVVLFA